MQDWKSYKLGDLVTVKGGKRLPKGQGYSIIKTKHPYIRLVDVKSGKVSDESIQYLDYDTHRKIHRYIVQENDVCLAIVGNTIGLVFYIDGKWNNANLTENAAKLTNLKGIKSKYLYYYLTSEFGQSEIRKNAIGSAQGKLPMYGIQNFDIALPPLIIQQQIGEVLSSLDDKIELNRQMNQTLEEMAQAMFKHYFVDGIDKDNLPVGWRVGQLGEVVNIKGGTTPSTTVKEYWNGNIYWTSPRDLSNIKSPYLTSTEKRVTKLGLSKISSGLLPVDTVLLSSRAPIGYVAICDIPLGINQGYIAILPDSIFSTYFMYFWLKENMDLIVQNANGSTFMEISKGVFRQLQTVIPDGVSISTFSRQASDLFNLIRSNTHETEQLISMRDYLLPKLISGEIIPADLKQLENIL